MKIQFQIRALIGLITTVAMGVGYVMHHRSRGVDRLVFELQKLDADFHFVGEQLVVDGSSLERVLVTNDSVWARLLGDTNSDIDWISLNQYDQNGEEIGAHLNAEQCRLLSQNHAVHSVQRLKFRLNSFPENAKMFFAHWSSLRYLEFRDTALPISWREKLEEMSQLEKVVISGALCNLSAEDFSGCKNLQKICLADQGIDQQRLSQLRRSMAPIEIQLLGGFDTKWKFDPNQSLSKHDPVSSREMKILVEEMHAAFARFKPSVEMNFNPPAKEEQIAELEREIGIPLPKHLRAFLEIHNGQQSDEYSHWLSCQEMIDAYRSRLEFDEYDELGYDFLPLYDFLSNPNYLQLTECIGISLVDGSLAGLDDQTGPYAIGRMHDLKQMLEEYVEYIEQQRATPNSGFEAARGTLLLQPDFWSGSIQIDQ